eukprot:sb/3477532/
MIISLGPAGRSWIKYNTSLISPLDSIGCRWSPGSAQFVWLYYPFHVCAAKYGRQGEVELEYTGSSESDQSIEQTVFHIPYICKAALQYESSCEFSRLKGYGDIGESL